VTSPKVSKTIAQEVEDKVENIVEATNIVNHREGLPKGSPNTNFYNYYFRCNHFGICEYSNHQLKVILNITQYSFGLRLDSICLGCLSKRYLRLTTILI